MWKVQFHTPTLGHANGSLSSCQLHADFLRALFTEEMLLSSERNQHEAGSKQGSSVPKMFFRVAVDFQRTTGRHEKSHWILSYWQKKAQDSYDVRSTGKKYEKVC
jgi:hypothetical protein